MLKKRMMMILTAAILSGSPATVVCAEPAGTFEAGGAQSQQMVQEPPTGEAPASNGGHSSAQQMFQAPPTGEAPAFTGGSSSDQQMLQAPPTGEAPVMDYNSSNEGALQEQTAPAAPNGEAPQMNSQAPQMNGSGQGQRHPAAPGQAGFGKQEHRNGPEGRNSFDEMVKDGTISQDTYDAIKKYMTENAPQKPEEKASGAAAEENQATDGNVKTDGTTKTDAGEATAETKKPEEKNLLSDLLTDGVITQEEYDAITAKEAEIKSSRPMGRRNRTSADRKPAKSGTAGSNADGSTADNSAAGGSTADNSAAGSNAANGSTADSNAAGSSAAGGSTANNNAVGNTTDGNNSATENAAKNNA